MRGNNMKSEKLKKDEAVKEDDMPAEIDFSKAKRGVSRGKIEPGDTDPRNAKVTVNMYLDGDIVQFFKNRAKRPGSAKYQTQINNALRDWMNLNQDEVFDSSLIDAIAKQVERR